MAWHHQPHQRRHHGLQLSLYRYRGYQLMWQHHLAIIWPQPQWHQLLSNVSSSAIANNVVAHLSMWRNLNQRRNGIGNINKLSVGGSA